MARASGPKKLSSLGTFLLVSVLAGMLIAGLAIPAAAMVGVSSNLVSTTLTELPVELETPPLPEPTTIYLADGSPMVQLYDEYRTLVSLDQIAPIMRQAQVAIEDDRFYSHGALDFKSLVKAVLTYFTSNDGGGGSTLTQQYVKQVLIEKAMSNPDLSAEERQAQIDAAQARTPARKISEMRMAIALEKRLTKDQILENYLNIAYYGDGAYGVEAAAHHYFNTTAANLTLAQSAMLAGIVQTPNRNPREDLPGALERRETVLNRMAEVGVITQEEADAAKLEGFDPAQIQYAQNGCANIEDKAYIQVCQFVVNTLMKNEHLGTPDSAALMSNLRLGGYSIQTTIDPVKQHATQDAISARIAGGDPVKASMVIMEPGTGRVIAAAQNRQDIATDALSPIENYANGRTDYQYFAPYGYGIDEGAQAGSTFKPFVAAAALNAGIPPSTRFNAKSRMVFGVNEDFRACDGAPSKPTAEWPVSNTSPSGVMDMYGGTANSVNTYYVQLEKLVGMCAAVSMARDVGVVTDPSDSSKPTVMDYQYYPSFVLGTAYTSPMQMAVAYSTFAARGVKCDPVVVASIKDRDGADIPTPNGNCQQVIRPEVADAVNAVTGRAFTSGTAVGWGVSDGRAMSGKTGTTEEGHDSWLIGFAPNIVGVATVGVDSNPAWDEFWASRGPNGKDLTSLRLPVSGTWLNGLGAADAGPMWQAAMNVAVQDLPEVPFTKPSSDVLNGKTVTPPSTSGMSPTSARAALEAAGFFVSEKQIYDSSAAGSYLGVGECQKVLGGTCYLLYSQGPRPEPTPTATATPAAPVTPPATTPTER
ncbi:MAG: penicillin-binding protein [Propionibacteriaceae bacterium]|jgi:membrane peptidoglycan carboxypeptidase|nr:penicillin-binding protein [Propionibacteriaceae bacterium]